MLQFDVRGSIADIEQHLTSLGREQVPFATVLALTRSAKFAQGELTREIGRVFDRPTRYTQSAVFVRPATKARMWAEVKIKDESVKGNPAVRYLIAQIRGGSRGLKGFEKLLQRNGVMPLGWYAVPTKYASLDANGNVPGGVIVKMLSQLQASRDSLTNENQKAKRKRNAKARAGRYFVAMPSRQRTKHLEPGIYERLGTAFGSGVRPILLFVPKAPQYARRLRFFEIADETARMRFPIEFAIAMREALRTARPRRQAA
jgi:hypothetical protein